eukprot:scaffold324666_cov58-Tisochrysis_lutea.AAC.1
MKIFPSNLNLWLPSALGVPTTGGTWRPGWTIYNIWSVYTLHDRFLSGQWWLVLVPDPQTHQAFTSSR